MAANETGFKQELTKAFRAGGAHVTVVVGSYLAGTPDLHITMPGFKSIWIELKFGAGSILTPLQAAFIERELKAGGRAAWLRCMPRLGSWQLYGAQDSVVRVTDEVFIMTREKGQIWDPKLILQALGL